MLGTDVVVRKTFDVGFLADNGNGDKKPKTLLGQIADNTQETVNILRTAVLGPSQQDLRDEGISKGDTDPPKAKGGGRFGKALKGIGGALDKVNPFSSNFMFGNIGRALLAGGGLILLKLFGDNLIGPLAKLLETIKNAKIGDSITDTYTAIKEKAVPIFEGIKENTITFIENAKAVFGLIQSAYRAVEAYVMSFDVKGSLVSGPAGMMIEVGDGILDEQEMKALTDDIRDRAVDAVSSFFGALFDALKVSIIGGLFLGTAVKTLLANPKVAAIFGSGKPFQGPVKPGAVGGAGVGTVLGIAALLAYGITATYSNYASSMEKTLKENEGKFDFSDFMANFMGGKDEGGVMNAFTKAYELGGTGALVGATIGSVIPGVGTIVGGLVGTLAGGLIGAATGYAGSNKMKSIFEKFGSMIDETVTELSNFFNDTIDAIKGLFTGAAPEKAADKVRLTGELNDLNKEYDQVLADIAENEKRKAANKPMIGQAFLKKEKLRLEDEIKAKEGEIANVPTAQAELDAGFTLEAINKMIGQKETNIGFMSDQYSELEGNLAAFNRTERMTELTNMINEESAQLSKLKSDRNKILAAGGNLKFTDTRSADQIKGMGGRFDSGMGGGNTNIITAHKTNADNIAHSSYSLGGMTVGNQDLITEELIKGVR